MTERGRLLTGKACREGDSGAMGTPWPGGVTRAVSCDVDDDSGDRADDEAGRGVTADRSVGRRGGEDVPHPHVRVPDERARLGAAGRRCWWPTAWSRPTTWRRPTSSSSTPAASGRTPTTSSTATWATSRRCTSAGPDMQIAVGGCLAQKDRDDDPAAGRPRRRGLRHPQPDPGPGLLRRAAAEGPMVEILDAPDPDGEPDAADHRRGPGRRARPALRGLGHHPDRVRQLVRLLHRPAGARAAR